MPDHGRPLSLSMRPDLAVSRESFGGRTFVVLKDPLSLRYFRLREEEFAILQLLDGRRSFNDLQHLLEARFAPQKFPPDSMSHFIASMHQSGLIRSELPGQAASLLKRRSRSHRRLWLQQLRSPLSLRIRGIDPTRLFDRMYPWFRWCFSALALRGAALLIASALGLLAVYHAEVLKRLPTWQEFFTPGNLLVLLALTAAIKVVHEIGHGLTCRHFGGEVHDLGLMFLVFAPCLYCNVSDAWRLPKRQRIAVSAAGILVELVIASCAAFGWWLSQPGLFQQFCLGAMFVSGVSTLLVNGNPLMRYDGYFILSDVVETPNLAEKSATVVRNFFAQLCFGIEPQQDILLPERRQALLAAYAIASAVYRLLLTFSIALFLIELARPYNLESLARLYAIVALAGFCIPSLRRFGAFVIRFRPQANFQRLRIAGTTTTAAAATAMFFLWPLPQRVWGILEIEPREAERIYIDVPGRLLQVRYRPGDRVAAGAVLGVLENVDLELEIAKLTGKATTQRAQLDALRRERFHSDSAALQIPELEKSLAALEESLTEKRSEAARLTLRAGRAGLLLPPPETPAPREAALGELPAWHGLPTDPRNLGATLAEGTFYAQIGEPHRWQAFVAIDQTDITLLEVGQALEICFDEFPDLIIQARVEEISRHKLQESPRRLSNRVGGELATEPDAAGVERPISTTYQVRVVFDDPQALLRIGLRGTARIHVAAEPLAPRVARQLARTFHFHF